MEGNHAAKTSHFALRTTILFSILCLLLLYCYSGWLSEFRGPMAPTPVSANSGSTDLTILLWHSPFGSAPSLKGDVCRNLYGIPRCRLVDQRSLFPSADVVVFHNRELIDGHQKLPLDLPRPRGQRWAWMSLESPAHNGNLQQFANVFNMTMSYRRDSDIPLPYGERLPKGTEVVEDTTLEEDVTVNKSDLICWVVSNFQSYHKRTQVYQQLSTVLPVQVYGRWSNRGLSASNLLPTVSRCYFYLAFENTISRDYITEKLWKNAYLGGAVPVVLGARLSDYKAVAPPNSFIHVDEFASINELAKYLQELAKDKKRYSEYFLWKRHWNVKLIQDWRERLCQICLHYDSLPPSKVYPDLMAWMNA